MVNEEYINLRKRNNDIVFTYEEFRLLTYENIERERYAIGEYGTVFDIKKDRFISPFRDKRKGKGYIRVGLKTIDEGRKKFAIHRLVAWEFCEGYSEDNNIVNHKNAITSDNHYSNLEWCNTSHNTIHKFHNGHYYNVRRKFDEKTVHYICQELEKGTTIADICRELTGVKSPRREVPAIYDTIQKIHIRRLYVDIASKYNF